MQPLVRSRLWVGRSLTGLALLFLASDAVAKLAAVPQVISGTVNLGYPPDAVRTLGVLELLCVLLCAIPRTSVLGAVLLTGFLGGAVATHLRLEHPLLTHTLFPTYVAALVWGGLILRDRRLRALLPHRATETP
jgi:hypothetical protein